MLPVPIEVLRVRIGLESTDATRDADIQLASNLSLMLMGSYCDRLFDQVVDYEEVFTHETGFAFPLIRYPVVSILSVEANNTITAYHIAKQRGVINLDYRGVFHQLTVIYTGGYAEGEFPDDLLHAFNLIFDQQMATIDGGTVTQAGEIQSVTVEDVGTIRYTTGGSEDNSSSGSPFLPTIASAILDNYKRYKC